MGKLQDQEYQDVAETALSYLDKLKCPVEVRAAVLKSVGIHIKDLIGATSHLGDATIPIRHPSEKDLEDWLGWNPALMETLKELDCSWKEDINESHICLDKIDVMLTQILQKLRGLEISNSLCEEKENQLLKNSKDSTTVQQTNRLINHWFEQPIHFVT